jgi:hypothetical protein
MVSGRNEEIEGRRMATDACHMSEQLICKDDENDGVVL